MVKYGETFYRRHTPPHGLTLKELIVHLKHLAYFPPLFVREITFVTPVCFSAYQVPFVKRFTLKGKRGANYFFRIAPFSEGK